MGSISKVIGSSNRAKKLAKVGALSDIGFECYWLMVVWWKLKLKADALGRQLGLNPKIITKVSYFNLSYKHSYNYSGLSFNKESGRGK